MHSIINKARRARRNGTLEEALSLLQQDNYFAALRIIVGHQHTCVERAANDYKIAAEKYLELAINGCNTLPEALYFCAKLASCPFEEVPPTAYPLQAIVAYGCNWKKIGGLALQHVSMNAIRKCRVETFHNNKSLIEAILMAAGRGLWAEVGVHCLQGMKWVPSVYRS